MDADLHALSATAIAARIAAGETSAEAVMRECLARIRSREAEIGAFVHLDPDAALAAARAADAVRRLGPLHGVPFAVKDIIDTADMPTAWGSSIHAGHRPRGDASCVALLRRAGAIPVGKSVTTEFAYFAPGKTANPHNPAHTPGGSSSGSAAAVADAMVPFALGSQTAGSLIRPASYCGIIGYRPSIGSFDLQGVMGLSPSLDTLGILARSLDDIALVRSVLDGSDANLRDDFDERPPRIALMRGPHWRDGSMEMRDACQRAIETLAGHGAEIGDLQHPASFDDLTDAQKTVMAFETARARIDEYTRHRDAISEQFASLVEAGLAVSRAHYEAARRTASIARRQLDRFFDEFDAILAPAAPGEAPEGLSATGDPLFSRGWTLLQVPSLSLPFGTGPRGLPTSVQLVGRYAGDTRLLAAARWVEQRLA